jgi:outer membrane protein
MKKGILIFNVVIVIAVIILFVLVLKPASSQPVDEKSNKTNVEMKEPSLVYVNTDSLLVHYEFAKYLKEQLLKKEEKSRTDYNEKAKVFQQEVYEYQRKAQNNGFLSLERAKQEQQRLAQQESDLQELNNRLSNQLMVEQGNVSQQLRDTLESYLKEIQPKYKFTMVLSNTAGDNVLYGEKGLDITNEIIKGLNARYASVSPKK